jgi:YggT family protein
MVLDMVLTLYMWLIIGRVIISWVNADPYNPIVRFLYNATEPVLYRVRRALPVLGGLDLSPLIVILGIYFLKGFLVMSLYDVARRMH